MTMLSCAMLSSVASSPHLGRKSSADGRQQLAPWMPETVAMMMIPGSQNLETHPAVDLGSDGQVECARSGASAHTPYAQGEGPAVCEAHRGGMADAFAHGVAAGGL
eukprot:482086-Pyramimonas_sp.AAC.1